MNLGVDNFLVAVSLPPPNLIIVPTPLHLPQLPWVQVQNYMSLHVKYDAGKKAIHSLVMLLVNCCISIIINCMITNELNVQLFDISYGNPLDVTK